MKKLILNKGKFAEAKILTRDQLRNILGGEVASATVHYCLLNCFRTSDCKFAECPICFGNNGPGVMGTCGRLD